MRLRRLEVRNWACIRALDLPELPDGIIVLSGPNRTGKSSLVQAIRSCLFDHDHNSKDATILGAIPRRTKAAPQVTVEFELAGKRYRIAKVFSTRKDGQAVLEQRAASGWTVVDHGKEASRRVRELLGVDRSQAGLYQLLWLNQGEVHLPRPKDVDAELTKAVEAVLGTMITGSDLDFKTRLDKACERWFTPTMRDKEHSPLLRLAKDLEEARAALADIVRVLAENERDLQEFERGKQIQPRLQREVEEAEQELSNVTDAWNKVRERGFKHNAALVARGHAQAELKRAAGRREEAQHRAKELEDANTQLVELQGHLQTATKQRDSCREEVDREQAAVRQAEARLQQHQDGQSDLVDRQGLLTIASQLESIRHTMERARGLDQRQKELEQLLAGPQPCSEQQLRDLRANRERATALRSRLEAGQIRLRLAAEKALSIRVAVDQEAATTVEVDAGKEHVWRLQQRGRMELPGVGTIAVDRGQADHELEDAARTLAQLDASYSSALTTAGLDLNDPAAIDKLMAQRFEHQRWSEELHSVREEFQRLAPRGLQAFDAERTRCWQARASILERHPDWTEWIPAQAEIDASRFEAERIKEQLSEAARTAQDALGHAQLRYEQSDRTHREVAEKRAIQQALVRSLGDQLTRLGARGVLAEAVAGAQAAADSAEEQVRATTLTEEEQGIETRHKAAESALKQRQERLRANELSLRSLEVKLSGTEGLHQKRINAEQTVNDLADALTREQRQSGAHRRLKELFEQVRQSQVQRTVGPVSDRVVQWMHHIGLSEYANLDFGDQLFPQGLVPRDPGADGSVGFDAESYGTLEQLGILVRLAVGMLLAKAEPAVAIFDDPFAHSDETKHRRMIGILQRAAQPGAADADRMAVASGPLQIIILTCHPARFDFIPDAFHVNLEQVMERES